MDRSSSTNATVPAVTDECDECRVYQPEGECGTLASRCRVPRTARAIERRRLVEALRAGPSLVWLAAPAGAGKTCALADYCEEVGTSIWYRCGPDDCDVATLVAQLSASLSRERRVERARLIASTPASLQAEVERIFSAVLHGRRDALLVVLDDAHLAQPSWQFVAALAGLFAAWRSLAPGGSRLIVGSRERPPTAFARLTLEGALRVLEGDLLQVDEIEAAALLGMSRLPLREAELAEVRSLLDASQGWMIAASALARDPSRRGDVGNSLLEYISVELFASLAVEVRHALHVLSWLPEFSEADVDALQDELAFEKIVTELERCGVPFQRKEHALCLHDLVRDVARSRLASECAGTDLGTRLLRRLFARRCIHEATALVAKLGLFQDYASLLEAEALTLADGRTFAVEHALNVLPQSLIEARPWLLYLRACCLQSSAPSVASPMFERALAAFGGTNDRDGERACAAALTIATLLIGQDFRATARWNELLGDASWQGPPSVIDVMVISALLARQAYIECSTPSALRAARHAMSLLELPLPAREALAICTHSTMIFLHGGQHDEAEVAQRIGQELRLRAPLDATVECVYSFALIYYSLSVGDFSGAVRSAEVGVALAESAAIPFLLNLAQAGAFGAFLSGDDKRSSEFALVTAREALLRPSHWNLGAVHLLQGWRRYEAGEHARAAEEFALTVEHSQLLGFTVGEFQGELGSAFAQVARGQYSLAEQALERATLLRNTLHASALDVGLHVCRAYLRLSMVGVVAARTDIAAALEVIGPVLRIATPLSGSIVRRLIEAAHSLGVAQANARRLQLQFRLAPPRDDLGPHWSWPIVTRALGSFQVERTGASVKGECPASSLALLKVLLAADGEAVEIDRTVNLLWRGSKSKRAAFDTALHRLRRYLGQDQLLAVQGGRLHLEVAHVWVDAWALKHLQAELATNTEELASMEAKLLSLYRGPFCDAEPWLPVAQARVRYARTFGRIILHLAHGWRECGEQARSEELILRGLAEPHLPTAERGALERLSS